MTPQGAITDVGCEDLIRTFLQHRPQATATAQRVALALRRTFVAETATVVVTEHSHSGTRVCGAAECKSLDGPAQLVANDAHEELLAELNGHFPRAHWPKRAVASDHIEWWVTSQRDSVFFGIGWRFDDDQVTIQSVLRGATEAHLAKTFDQSVCTIELFASAVRSLHLIECTQRAEDRRANLRRRLDAVLHPSRQNFPERLEDLIDLLGSVAQSADLGSRDDLHSQVLRLAHMTVNRFLQHQGAHNPTLLQITARNLSQMSRNPALSGQARGELALLAECINGLHGRVFQSSVEPRKLASDDLQQVALWLLALSSRAYTHAISSSEVELENADVLGRFAWLIRLQLPQLLIGWSKVLDDSHGRRLRRSTAVRNWLHVWLVLDLVNTKAALNVTRQKKRELLIAIAFVLREGIRYELHCRTPGFTLDWSTLTQVRQDLVVAHALAKNETLRDFGLECHLRNMEASGSGRWNGEGHQAHILDVYILGNFLLDLCVGEPTQPIETLTPMSRIIAGAGPQRQQDLRAAFCLAALFHDAGMLMFPLLAHPESSPIEQMKAIGETYKIIQSKIDGAAASLVNKCIDELSSDRYFDVTEPWEPWLERQKSSRRPEHELLGAWFLQRACQNATGLQPEVIRAAVRATLLHGAQGIQVDASKDATAALLMFCDELCDWYPAHKPSPHRHDLGRRLNDQVMHHRKRHGRAKELIPHDLWLRIEGQRLIVGILPASAANRSDTGWPGGTACWPRFELTLREPSELDVAVLEIWLRSAQNLGRLVCGNQPWQPAIKLTSTMPDRLKKVQKTTRELLDQLAQRLDPTINLRTWLRNSELFIVDSVLDTEAVYLVPGAGPSVRDHIAVCMDEIVDCADDIVQQWEAVNLPAH